MRSPGAATAPTLARMAEFRVVLHTTRFDESCAFYGDALGWTHVRGWDDGGRGCLWAADTDSVVDQRVELLEADTSVAPTGVFVSVEVVDVAAAYARLTEAGARITQPLADQPWGHRNTATVDPNGLTIVLFEVL